MEPRDLWSSKPEGTQVIDIEHAVTSDLMPISPPSPIKKQQYFFLPLASKTIFMAWSALLSQRDGKCFSIKSQGETKKNYNMQDFRIKS